MRLKHAISTTSGFGHCECAVSCREGLARLDNTEDRVDLIFISYHFSSEEIKEFAVASRSLKSAQDAAFVMILPSGFAKNDALADTMLAGVDGFLVEPFSCDDLLRMSQLAAKVKRDRSISREQMAIQFIVKDVVRLLDTLYCLHRNELETEETFMKLRDVCARVREFQPVAQELYLSLLVETCERTLQPVKIPLVGFRAKSARARKKVEQMMAAEMASPKPKLDPKKVVRVDGKILKLPPLKP
jgi:response regulator RpfG family c-di-GMP phosphodiesterase